ncbi:cuticle protein-like [Chelonus insularis]|uniref:cuticle protein-like n=1 Tax=Chelonus insularis TaxID=460826 RepID=UPI00158A1B06|nr:cuticle protein-like [Chelonus insularis]
MASKFIAFAAVLAVANAGLLHTPSYISGHIVQESPLVYTPVAKTIVKTVDTEFDHNPNYSFSYGVHDSLTGDAKSQHETRNGDAVSGSYSVVDSDGTKRTVDYTADDVNGFNAVVRKEPAKIVAPVVKAPVVLSAQPAQIVYKSAELAYPQPVAYAKVW